ncbi:pentapeptide repeat protein [Kribbella steppae]|uniref:Pentapeptide repeat protein n=1 Tax=Kribbella steppae TaxID=2512223 RepID=A0A4R2HT55_9ACTN|nr:DinB family protein [Kribbella steppae]TCO34553.1 pentapeptide repeat protein [Kribbella steppae]
MRFTDGLSGKRIERVDLTGTFFRAVDLRDARFEQVVLTGARMRGVDLSTVTVDGDVEGLVINGVDVAPFVYAELDRRYPDRVKMRPTDPAGFRTAWDIVEHLWDGTVARARAMRPELLHERVDGEWSFIETLRHLVFATDAWVGRVILGDPRPWDALDLPFDGMGDVPGVPWDRAVRPSLDEVLALRKDRMAVVRRYVDELTDEQLETHTTPVPEPGWPDSVSYPVRDCLLMVLNEEWQHRLYAERDLDILSGN